MNSSKPEYELVQASRVDASQLADLRVAAMRESLERIGRFDPARARRRFLDGFDPGRTQHIVVAGVRAGFVVVKRSEGEFVLDHLYVHPAHQGAGLGGAVLAEVLAAADVQAARVRVTALLLSDANRFYRRHGFELERTSEFDNWYVRSARR